MRTGSLVLFFTVLIALASLGAVGWLWWLTTSVEPVPTQTDKNPHFLNELAEITKEVVAPGPLRGPLGTNAGALTIDGVFTETNRHRQENNRDLLVLNPLLNKAASNKINDMFAQQYFDHVSPDGKGPGDVVDTAGYDYIRVGENLALGNFESDEALVIAWMNSPGHRTNMLSIGFTEIGIAVRQGTFEGRSTWLAVQTFGTPGQLCTKPDQSLKQAFEAKGPEQEALKNAIGNQGTLFEQKKATVQSLGDRINGLVEQGNAKIQEGNQEIEKGNELNRAGSEQEAKQHWERGEQLQQEGQRLLDEARSKSEEFESQRAALVQLQTSYNELVTKINALSKEVQNLGSQFNAQVEAYNKCVQGYSEE